MASLILDMLLSVEVLHQIMPDLPRAKTAEYAPLLAKWCEEFEINTPRRLGMFLATLAEESGQLTKWRENLYYSPERLMKVWPSRFRTRTVAQQFARKPEVLANYIYGTIKGKELGNTTSPNDGWLYRGGGPGQATGRKMYQALTDALGQRLNVDLVAHPERIEEAEIGIAATCWIWAKEKELNEIADQTQPVVMRINGRGLLLPPFSAVTQKWNGGQTNLQSRMAFLKRAGQALGLALP